MSIHIKPMFPVPLNILLSTVNAGPVASHGFTSSANLLRYCAGRSKVDYDTVLADSEREAVADLLGYLENVCAYYFVENRRHEAHECNQRAETDFFAGDPLNALSTLVYSQNLDLQRSASLTFAEITERGKLLSTKRTGTSRANRLFRCTGS